MKLAVLTVFTSSGDLCVAVVRHIRIHYDNCSIIGHLAGQNCIINASKLMYVLQSTLLREQLCTIALSEAGNLHMYFSLKSILMQSCD